MELPGPRPHVLLLLPGRGRPGRPAISLVEEISDLDANGPVSGRLPSLPGPTDTPVLWLLSGCEPRHHVQRLSLLVPLPRILPRQIHQQIYQVGCEWKQKREIMRTNYLSNIRYLFI